MSRARQPASESEPEEDPWTIDADGIRLCLAEGLPAEVRSSGPASRWATTVTADILDPDFNDDTPFDETDHQSALKRYEDAVLGNCGACLVRPELMRHRARELKSLDQKGNESTLEAVETLFDSQELLLKNEFRRKGIWGSDSNDTWILIIERLYVQERARRQGWGLKLVERIFREILSTARDAGKPVLILALPSIPEKEFTSTTQQSSLMATRAFWRALGFVRMGETLFYGWTRGVGPDLVKKSPVDQDVLDEDEAIDQRQGYTL